MYQFDKFQLDCGRFELLLNGKAIRVQRKAMELLILLASRQGQLVTRAEIAERLWSSEVFVDTEHGINTVVRKLRHVLRDDADEPRFIQTVTGMGYRFVAPLGIVNASAAPPKTTPETVIEGFQPSGDTAARSRASEALSGSARRFGVRIGPIAIAAISIVVAVSAFAAFRWSQHRKHAPITALAVIPLENLSGDPAEDYLADGMTDELTTMLAKDSTLRIVSRTSVMQYKHAHQPLRDIARALGVDAIVEGSVARTNRDLHLNLQLIQAATDSHIWAESYDRDADDVALPDEAARAIASRLQSAAPSASMARPINPAAHDAYLRGRYLWLSDRDSESGAYFEKATEIQPDYAAAWAGLANYYGKGIAGDELDPRTAISLQEKAAERAVSLDPNLAEAHLAMAAVYLIDRWDPRNADREILRAIEIDPHNADFYYLRADVMTALHRHKEALQLAKESMELAPTQYAELAASMYIADREYDAALAELQVRLEGHPSDPTLLFAEEECLRRKGNYREAAEVAAKAENAMGDERAAAAIRNAWKQGGWHAYIRWQLARELARSKSSYISPVELAGLDAQLGKREPTLSLLEEGFRQHSTDILWIDQDPAFDFLRADPRFQSILQRTQSQLANN